MICGSADAYFRLGTALLRILLGLTIAGGAHAAMYRCTDAAGNTSFSDKPCPTMEQKVMKERRYPAPKKKSPGDVSLPEISGSGIEPIKPLPGGRKVRRNSPLAKAYRNAVALMKRCDRSELQAFAKNPEKESPATDLDSLSESELKEQCVQFGMIFPRADFKDATEVINGDKGTIQWLTVETTREGGETSTMRSEQTVNFIKKGGVWWLD